MRHATLIAPVAPADITDPELQALIARCKTLGVPDETFPGILAHVPAYAKALLRALLMSHTEGNVDHRLKEIIRLQLTRRSGDPYFGAPRPTAARKAGLDEATITAGCDDCERSKLFTEKEKWALCYADQMYMNAASVDAGFYAGMKQHCTEAGIMELGAFIALHYGLRVFMRTLAQR